MEILNQMLSSVTTSIGPMLLLLGVLIFVHEFGHFIVAKYFGVRVEVFCLGFGKKLLQYQWGDTNYCIALIPLGGYVKLFGDDPTKEVSEDEKKFSFLHQKVFPKICIVAAGPLINLIFAFFLFMAVAMIGERVPAPILGLIDSSSVASNLGFKTGDTIIKIDDQNISDWSDAKLIIENSANKELAFTVKREIGGAVEVLRATPALEDNENIISDQSKVGTIAGFSVLSNASAIGVLPGGLLDKAKISGIASILKINGKEVRFYRQLGGVLNSEIKKTGKVIVEYSTLDNLKPLTTTIEYSNKKEFNAEEVFGYESSHLYLMSIKKDSPASKAGLLPKDKLVSINGNKLKGWEDVLKNVKAFKAESKTLTFGVLRNGVVRDIKITPKMTTLMTKKGQEESRYTIGIAPAYYQAVNAPVIKKISNPLDAFTAGVERSVKWTKWTIVSFVRLAEGQVSIKNVGGVISIGRVASQSYDAGISSFLKIMAIISVNLFLLNLLPVPVLDGGHLIFFIIEAIKGSPLSMRKMEIAQTFGLVMLMMLMSFALFNDVVNWFDSAKW